MGISIVSELKCDTNSLVGLVSFFRSCKLRRRVYSCITRPYNRVRVKSTGVCVVDPDSTSLVSLVRGSSSLVRTPPTAPCNKASPS